MKVSELQEELALYQRECQKLRNVNEKVIRIAQGRGFSKQLQQHKSVKQFMDLNMGTD